MTSTIDIIRPLSVETGNDPDNRKTNEIYVTPAGKFVPYDPNRSRGDTNKPIDTPGKVVNESDYVADESALVAASSDSPLCTNPLDPLCMW